MKKNVRLCIGLTVTAVLVSSLIACGGGSAPAATTAAPAAAPAASAAAPAAAPAASAAAEAPAAKTSLTEKVVIRVGNNMADDNQWNVNMRKYAELVDEATGGMVEVQLYPNAQLGDDQAMAEMVRSGNLDIQITSGAVPGRWYTPMAITEMPFLFEGFDHLEACLYGDVGDYMSAGLEENNFHAFAYWLRANRQILSTKPIETVDDLKNLKIRVPETEIWVNSMKALGTNPTPVAYSECFTALQQGVVAAVENPLASMYSQRFHEICHNLALSNHVGSFSMAVMSPQTWAKLPEDVQKIMNECMDEITASNNEITRVEDDGYIEKMKAEVDLTVTNPDYETMKKMVVPVQPEIAAAENATELYDMIKALAPQ